MVTASESKAAMLLVGDAAVDTVEWTIRRTGGSFESRRLTLLETVPGVIGYYSEGTSALAADFYDDARAAARAPGRFTAEPVVLDRTVRIRRGVAWASEPLSTDDADAAMTRLAEVVRAETSRPYRDTILTNRRRDPQSAGWRRVTSTSGCRFCRMLADRGAVYKENSALFAAHPNCSCTAAPVFKGGELGPEADVMQYLGSKRHKTEKDRARLREYLDNHYPE